MGTVQDVLRIAGGEVGYSRWDDPKPGTKYGRWYAGRVGDPYYGESGVPYCAMFVSWVLDQAGVACAGFPGAYCPDMIEEAADAGATLFDIRQARPGDVVFFEWNGDDETDHVGIVTENLDTCLETIEGNTSPGDGSQSNGGVVARRRRFLNSVYGIVRPNYGGECTDEPLDVDSLLGEKSVTKWQRQLGTEPDGVITGQRAEDAKWWPNLVAIDDYDGSGSQLVRKVQQIVGVPNPTGVWSRGSICMMQGWLHMRGYDLRDAVAGMIDAPTAAAIQESINDGEWA